MQLSMLRGSLKMMVKRPSLKSTKLLGESSGCFYRNLVCDLGILYWIEYWHSHDVK